MTFVQFMHDRVGAKWVVLSRRTPNLRRRYSDSVLLTVKQFAELKAEYERSLGSVRGCICKL